MACLLFDRLSRDVRIIIYEYALVEEHATTRPGEPSITKVSRVVREEALPVHYRVNTIQLQGEWDGGMMGGKCMVLDEKDRMWFCESKAKAELVKSIDLRFTWYLRPEVAVDALARIRFMGAKGVQVNFENRVPLALPEDKINPVKLQEDFNKTLALYLSSVKSYPSAWIALKCLLFDLSCAAPEINSE